MIPLRTCRHRHNRPDGRYDCTSPKLIVGPSGVDADICHQCPYADQDGGPVPQERTHRALPCHWAGETVREMIEDEHGQRRRRAKQRLEQMCCGKPPEWKKVFACDHPRRLGDEVTVKDCYSCPLHSEPKEKVQAMTRLLLHHPLSPGDTLVASAAIECLARQHGDKYLISCVGTADEVWEKNPHVVTFPWLYKWEEILEDMRREDDAGGNLIIRRGEGTEGLPNVIAIRMKYPLIHECNQRPVHFIQGHVDYLAEVLGVPIRLDVNRPFIYLTEEEKSWKGRIEELTGYPTPYWLLCSGVKNDYTVKAWGHDRYQEVVDALLGRVQFVQVGEEGHSHKRLRGVIDQIGKTSIRELIRLAYHAQGVLCGETFLHHIAAAFEKPCVCLASGMDPRRWQAYETEAFLSSHGQLDCCRGSGCGKARVVPLGDGDEKDVNLCWHPLPEAEPVAKCLAMIIPARVIEAILAYYEGGILCRVR